MYAGRSRAIVKWVGRVYCPPATSLIHGTVKLSRKCAFPSDQASQAGLGPISSELSDHSRIPGAVLYFFISNLVLHKVEGSPLADCIYWCNIN